MLLFAQCREFWWNFGTFEPTFREIPVNICGNPGIQL